MTRPDGSGPQGWQALTEGMGLLSPTWQVRAGGCGLGWLQRSSSSREGNTIFKRLLLNSTTPSASFNSRHSPACPPGYGPCQFPPAEVGFVHVSMASLGGPGIWLLLEGLRCCRGLGAEGRLYGRGRGPVPSTHTLRDASEMLGVSRTSQLHPEWQRSNFGQLLPLQSAWKMSPGKTKDGVGRTRQGKWPEGLCMSKGGLLVAAGWIASSLSEPQFPFLSNEEHCLSMLRLCLRKCLWPLLHVITIILSPWVAMYSGWYACAQAGTLSGVSVCAQMWGHVCE